MPKRIASLFSGCGGLDLGFTGALTSEDITITDSIQISYFQTISTKMPKVVTMLIRY